MQFYYDLLANKLNFKKISYPDEVKIKNLRFFLITGLSFYIIL